MKKIFITLTLLISCGILLINLTGCTNEDSTYNNETTYTEETTTSEEIKQEVKEENLQEIKEESQEEVKYEFLQVVTLKDNSKWIVIEQSDGYVDLLSTGSKFKSSYNKDEYPGKDIFDRLEEYKTQLKSNLDRNGANTSNIDVRIPTIEDFEKYFNISSSEFLNGHGIIFNDEQFEILSKYFNNNWCILNSTYPGNNNNITTYALNNNWKSFWFLKGGHSKDSSWGVAVILKTPIENITDITDSSNN